jgi:hypothetical protein
MLKKMAAAVLATGILSMTAIAQEFDVQGHRGARGLSPENTLVAFARALTIGVSTLELDVSRLNAPGRSSPQPRMIPYNGCGGATR